MVETDADLAEMFSSWDSVTFTPANSYPNQTKDTIDVKCLFDNAFVDVGGVETLMPTVTGRSVDLSGAVYGSMVEKGADKYKVVSMQPDGTGVILLGLEKG